MLFYTALSNWIIVISSYRTLGLVINNSDKEFNLAYYFLTSYVLSFTLAIVISIFFVFHIWLVMNQYTTIEYCEKRKEGDENYEKSPYNVSYYRNLEQCLGSNILCWFIPVSKNCFTKLIIIIIGPDLVGDGMIFEIRSELKKKS